MKHRVYLGLALSWTCALPVYAQQNFQDGERLSNWLLRQDAASDPTGLVWLVPEEIPAQARLKRSLLDSPSSRGPLAQWIASLPITGRVALALADARWLQAHKAQDPILRDGQSLRMAARSPSVSVVLADGRLCQLPHTPGAGAQNYVVACTEQATPWAWIAQPDGRVERVGLTAWNAEPQSEPAPGAWVWAPSQASAMPERFSEALAQFLATQGPAQAQPNTTGNLAALSLPLQSPIAQLRPPALSANDWGGVGLLQTPSARMGAEGAMNINLSHVAPYTNLNVMLQPLDGLEAGFRYTSISNRIYGITTQAFKDKSFDFKLRLAKEGNTLPELALGMRDFGGTGLFSSEYLVANKRSSNFDWSLGLAWGYMGARGSWGNPFSFLGSKYNTRAVGTSLDGGTLNGSGYFKGRTSPFGGVQWLSPVPGLVAKLEYDGNNYQHEPLGNNQPVKTPFNLGAVYRYAPGVDFSAAIERGNTLMLGLTLYTDLRTLQAPKSGDPALPRFTPNMPSALPAWGSTARDIEAHTGWSVFSITQQGAALQVALDQVDGMYRQERVERMLAVLHRDAPDTVRRFVLSYSERGLPLSAQEVNRAAWVERHNAAQPTALQSPAGAVWNPNDAAVQSASTPPNPWLAPAKKASWAVNPSYSQILGGPDAFLLFQLGIAAAAEYKLSNSTWLSGDANLRLADNYAKFTYDAPSNLPRVRTYAREYTTSSRLTLPNLQLTHVEQIAQDQYLSAYGGLLEPMFAGVGAEWLYRPWRSSVAVGVDVNHVYQRGFNQDFSLLAASVGKGYSVNTGHATLYWDTGWNGVQTKIMAGRYLAGDRGVTVDFSRSFGNAVTMGAYFTKTNVSAAQFGEGSFDKGVYVRIPFDAMLSRSSTQMANIAWSPLTRDGGARLQRANTLIDITAARDQNAFAWHSPASNSPSGNPATNPATTAPVFTTSSPAPSDLVSTAGAALGTLGTIGSTLAQQVVQEPSASSWLWAGSAVLGAALLDKRVDRFAQNHQTGWVQQTAKASKALPWVIMGGTGLAATGLFGKDESATAYTAVQAASLALLGNTALRYAIGRARPDQNLGNSSFSGFSNGATGSGFPSNHAVGTFALVTPFAQRYDMPWLYGLAGAVSMGRVMQRQHWLSDVVAGGLVGYASGSFMLEQQNARAGKAQVMVGPGSVTARWTY